MLQGWPPDCFVSSFGVATGLAMLLMSIGPGALFLYRASMRRIDAARRAGGGPERQ
jgi:hypothetical protein